MEKYSISEQDANDLSDFLLPILDFVPDKRPTAADCLKHPWINAGPRLLEPSVACIPDQTIGESTSDKKRKEKDEREAMEVGMGNIAIDPASKPVKESQPVLNSAQ